jgi:hypothetical protein
MVDWKNLEERGARWANMLSLLPGSYCAYIIWQERHTGAMWSMSAAFAFSLVVFFICICIGAILNFLRSKSSKPAPLPQDESPKEAPPDPCIGLFDPLQIEAFRYTKDLTQFLFDEMKSFPSGGDPRSEPSDVVHQYSEQRNAWRKRVDSKYQLQFIKRGEELSLKFGAIGVHLDFSSFSPGVKGIEKSILEDI